MAGRGVEIVLPVAEVVGSLGSRNAAIRAIGADLGLE